VLKMQGEVHRLTDERIQKLNDIGFVWVAKANPTWKEMARIRNISNFDDTWEERFQELKAYKQTYGTLARVKIFFLFHSFHVL
jgi:hypothetical protein